QIQNTLLTSSTGKTATLGSIADIRNEAGQTEILRENLQRDVAVTGRFQGVSLGKGIAAVQRAVNSLQLPPAIRVVYGGTYEDQRFRAEGSSARDAMLQAGERRLRPILMTALATVAGMIPLSLAFGAGSQMLQPLAIAVIGGILASMVLSLIVTPAVHYYMSDHTATN